MPARADDSFRCVLKEAPGVPQADAATAARVICDQLRLVSGERGEFGVGLATLGKAVLVTATRSRPAASVVVQLDGIEELPVAAERIARALVEASSFESTQRVDNLLEAETRTVRVKKGSLKFTAGVANVEAPGHGARAAGYSLGLVYSSSRFALPAEWSHAWSPSDHGYQKPQLRLYSLSVGARYYLSSRNVSPFVGGGVGISKVSMSEGGYGEPGGTASYFDAERSGVAPYLDLGVEALRLHRGRVAFRIRADFPTGALEGQSITVYSPSAGRQDRSRVVYAAESRYVVPVSIGLSVAF